MMQKNILQQTIRCLVPHKASVPKRSHRRLLENICSYIPKLSSMLLIFLDEPIIYKILIDIFAKPVYEAIFASGNKYLNIFQGIISFFHQFIFGRIPNLFFIIFFLFVITYQMSIYGNKQKYTGVSETVLKIRIIFSV